MKLKLDNIDDVIRLKAALASAQPILSQKEENNLPVYKPKYVMHHIHAKV